MQMRLKTKNFHVAFLVVITSMNNCHIDIKFSFAQGGADVLTVRET